MNKTLFLLICMVALCATILGLAWAMGLVAS